MADLDLKTLRVLAVVDDPFLTKTLRAQLEASGIEQIAVVTQPADTFETPTGWRPSLMVCDHRLEPVTGLGLIRQIRSDTESPFRFIPIMWTRSWTRRRPLYACATLSCRFTSQSSHK